MKTVLLPLSLLVSSVSAQQTWTVNCAGGPGVDFTDLPPAVAAAAPGDTILVYQLVQTPCQQPYTAPTINKPLRIEGATVSGVPLQPPYHPTGVVWDGVLIVTGIAAGQQVVLSNLGVVAPFSTTTPVGLLVTDCPGSVLLEDVSVGSWGLEGTSVQIVRCADVTLRDAYIRYGGTPVHIEDSNVLITTSIVQPDPPLVIPFPQPGWRQPYTQLRSPGLHLVRSDVTVIGSGIWGYSSACNSGLPQAAVDMWNSTLRIGPASLVLGCSAGPSYSPWVGTPALNIVHIDPRRYQVVTHFSPAPITTWMDSTYHSRLIAGYPYGVTVAGPPGGLALLLVGERTATPAQLPFGTIHFDPQTAIFLGLVGLSTPWGYHSWNLNCPATAPVAFPMVFQALTLSTTGQFGVTIPSPFTVAWPPTVMP